MHAWTAQLVQVAKAWATKLAAEDRFEHSPSNEYGENVYVKWSSNTSHQITGKAPISFLVGSQCQKRVVRKRKQHYLEFAHEYVGRTHKTRVKQRTRCPFQQISTCLTISIQTGNGKGGSYSGHKPHALYVALITQAAEFHSEEFWLIAYVPLKIGSCHVNINN